MEWIKAMAAPLISLVNKAKWFLLIAGFVITAGGSFWAGMTYEKGRWDAQTVIDQRENQKVKDNYEKQIAAQQTDADKQAQSFSEKLQDEYALNQNLDRRLHDEVGKNSVYRTCIIPDDGVRLYEASRTGHPVPTSQPPR